MNSMAIENKELISICRDKLAKIETPYNGHTYQLIKLLCDRLEEQLRLAENYKNKYWEQVRMK